MFCLSIQDMDPLEEVVRSLKWALRPQSRVVLLMTHPAFRRKLEAIEHAQSMLSVDEARSLIREVLQSYLDEQARFEALIEAATTVLPIRPGENFLEAAGS